MKKTEITSMTTSEIEALLKSKEDYKIAFKLVCILSLSKGESSRKAQEIFKVSHNQICIWGRRFNKDGIEGLRDKPKAGRKSSISVQQLDWLNTLVLEESPTTYGYNTETWTAPLLVEMIKRKCNIQYSDDMVYILLKRKLNLTHKKGKGFYKESDTQQRGEFVKMLKKTP